MAFMRYALADDAVLSVENQAVRTSFGALIQWLAGVTAADLAALLVGAVAMRTTLATVDERRTSWLITAAQLVAMSVLSVAMLALQQALVLLAVAGEASVEIPDEAMDAAQRTVGQRGTV